MRNVKNTIQISRQRVLQRRGVVVLDLEEYERLRAQAVPTYHLTGKAAERVDKVVEEGLRAYERGETIEANSLDEALKIYERKKSKRRWILKKVPPLGKEASSRIAFIFLNDQEVLFLEIGTHDMYA